MRSVRDLSRQLRELAKSLGELGAYVTDKQLLEMYQLLKRLDAIESDVYCASTDA